MNDKDFEKLVFGVAHQIRNPCAIILANTDLMIRKMPPNADMKKSLEAIVNGVKYIEARLDEFIEFSKPLQPKIEPIALSELCAEAVSIVKERSELQKTRITSDVPKDLPKIKGDRQHLLLALLNILMNAIESIKVGGTVALHGSHSERGIKLTVQDSGSGIHPRDLPEIFSPFYSTKEGGLGIGLPIARKMLDANDARITIESEMGKGTLATLRFSLAQ